MSGFNTTIISLLPWFSRCANKKAAGELPAARVKFIESLQPGTQEATKEAIKVAPEAHPAKSAVVIHLLGNTNKSAVFVNACWVRCPFGRSIRLWFGPRLC